MLRSQQDSMCSIPFWVPDGFEKAPLSKLRVRGRESSAFVFFQSRWSRLQQGPGPSCLLPTLTGRARASPGTSSTTSRCAVAEPQGVWRGAAVRKRSKQTAAVNRSVEGSHTVRARLASKRNGQRDKKHGSPRATVRDFAVQRGGIECAPSMNGRASIPAAVCS